MGWIMVNVVVELPKVALGSFTSIDILLGLLAFFRGLPKSLKVETDKIEWEFTVCDDLKRPMALWVRRWDSADDEMAARISVAISETMRIPGAWNGEDAAWQDLRQQVVEGLSQQERGLVFILADQFTESVGIDWLAGATQILLVPGVRQMN